MSKKSLITGTASLALASLVTAAAMPAMADGFYGDVRYRYENVDQDGIANDADASTIRTKLGYKSDVFSGFQWLAEGENTSRVFSDNYNDTNNGKTMYPVVADPQGGIEVNQLWVSYAGIPDTLVKAGRQGINLNNQRFVGTVGWRQNDQTFDSVLITNSSVDNLSLAFTQISKVNRIFGDDSPKGELDGTTRAANAIYKVSDSLSVTGYGLWIDLDDMALYGLSSKTYGVRVTGNTAVNDDWKLVYEAEFAEQSDYGDNPANYNVSYFHVSPALKWKSLTLQVGFESLEGNGSQAFQTPLATGHKFNGWADKFLGTPDYGLEDLYAKVAYVIKGQNNLLDNTKLVAVYHEFDSESGSMSYGNELDLVIAHPLSTGNLPFLKNGSVSLKYADFNSDGSGAFSGDADTTKWWLTTQYKF